MDRRRSSYIVPEIYEATTNPDHWDYVATMIAKLTRSGSACLYHKSKAMGLVNRIANFKMPDRSGLAFGRGENSLVRLLAEQSVINGNGEARCVQMGPALNGSPGYDADIYHRWAKPNHIHHVAGSRFLDSETHEAGVVIMRDEESGAWEDGELRVIDEIIPHLKRALNIYSEFAHLRLKRDALLSGLDRLVVGLIIYDKDAHPLYINPTARSIIERHPSLKFQKNGMLLCDSEEARKLHQAIIDTAEIHPEDSWRQSVSIGITHPDMSMPMPLLVTAIQTDMISPELDYQGARVAVFLSDPEIEQPISAESLINVYGLTKSEAQVAISIANGNSIEEIAKRSSHSVHTIRSQLKSVFSKTGVSRQSELIKLLLTGPFAHRRRSIKAV